NFVEQKHAGSHDFGGLKGFAEVALRFAIVLAVEHAEIETEQRNPEDTGGGLGGEAFTAALYSEQKHAARRIEIFRGIVAEEALAHVQPLAQAVHAADFGELRGLVLEGKRRVASEEFVFGAHDLGNIGFGDGAI